MVQNQKWFYTEVPELLWAKFTAHKLSVRMFYRQVYFLNRWSSVQACMGVKREEYKLEPFENKIHKKIFGHEKHEVSNLGYYVTMKLVICTGHLLMLG